VTGTVPAAAERLPVTLSDLERAASAAAAEPDIYDTVSIRTDYTAI